MTYSLFAPHRSACRPATRADARVTGQQYSQYKRRHLSNSPSNRSTDFIIDAVYYGHNRNLRTSRFRPACRVQELLGKLAIQSFNGYLSGTNGDIRPQYRLGPGYDNRRPRKSPDSYTRYYRSSEYQLTGTYIFLFIYLHC